MPAISPASGPVAVTGASGYIGSWAVYDLAAQGYQVTVNSYYKIGLL